MVRCGVVWCGVVWYGVVGVVFCGLVRCGVVWCGVVWYVENMNVFFIIISNTIWLTSQFFS